MIHNESKKRVAIIGTVGLPAKYGGFETLAHHLVVQLGHQYNMSVYCSGKKYPKEERKQRHEGANLVYLPFEANGVQSILYDTISILHALFYADVLLILGVSGAWVLPFVKLFTNKKIIISIDGVEWKRDKWSLPAKWYLFWAEKIAVKYSHADISDNESIQDYTAIRYQSLSNVIEYGADHAMRVLPEAHDMDIYTFLSKPYAFKVCRIEPENNVHVILKAFSMVNKFPIVIVGNWTNSQYGRELKKEYGGRNNFHLLDPIYDQRSLDLLRGNAAVYIHGHSAGGTNPSLVEAMYLGLPILAYHVSYNKTTTEDKAYYFSDAKSLEALLRSTTAMELKTLGQQMEIIAKRKYRWDVVAQKYNYLIHESLTINAKISVQPKIYSVDFLTLYENGLAHLAGHKLFYEK